MSFSATRYSFRRSYFVFFSSHIIHHALALYALGAPGRLIKAAYDEDKSYQRKAFESPSAITESNFTDHVGDDRYVFTATGSSPA